MLSPLSPTPSTTTLPDPNASYSDFLIEYHVTSAQHCHEKHTNLAVCHYRASLWLFVGGGLLYNLRLGNAHEKRAKEEEHALNEWRKKRR